MVERVPALKVVRGGEGSLPGPEIDAMRRGIAEAALRLERKASRSEGLLANMSAKARRNNIPFDGASAPLPMSRQAMHNRFRSDMRRLGLVPYEIRDAMLGSPYYGPAVNVRDPAHARAGTDLLLVTHGLATGDFRVYPTLSPIRLA